MALYAIIIFIYYADAHFKVILVPNSKVYQGSRLESILLLLLTLNFGCDQISKKIAHIEICEYEHISIIKDRFTLLKIENTGAFLSLGDEMPYIFRLIILTGLPLLFLGYGIYYLFAKRNLPVSLQIALCFLIGSGFGNPYDRIIHRSVTDFMHMDFYFFQTGVF